MSLFETQPTHLQSTEVLVRCSGVAVTYGSGQSATVALHDADLTISAGQMVALVGRSGSGKSTLLHVLAGLQRPTYGHVEWPGLGTDPGSRPGAIGVIFQAPSLLAPLNVVENVEVPLLIAGIEAKLARQKAIDALETLGLPDLATKLPEELSGGQSQRVAAARVLATSPILILADEPTGQLDMTNAELVVGALLATAHRHGAALVVATHDSRVAARLSDQIFVEDGKVRRRTVGDFT